MLLPSVLARSLRLITAVLLLPLFLTAPQLLAQPADSLNLDSEGYRFYAKGLEYYRASKFDSSLSYLRKSYDWYTERKQWVYAAKAGNKLLTVKLGSRRKEGLSEDIESVGTLATNHLPEAHPERVRYLINKSRHLTNQGSYKEALTWVEKAGSYLQGVGNRSLSISYRTTRGDILDYLGRFKEAIGAHLEALELAKAGGEEFDDERMDIYNLLSLAYQHDGDFDLGLKYLLEGEELIIQKEGQGSGSLGAIYSSIGRVFYFKGDYTTSLEYNRKLLEIFIENYGPDSPYTAIAYNNISLMHEMLGNQQQAVETLNKSLEIKENYYGEGHPELSTGYINLGILLKNDKKYEEAAFYLKKALTIRQENLGDDHPEVVVTHASLGDLYFEMGSYEEANIQYERQLEIAVAKLGGAHPYLIKSYVKLGQVQQKLDNLERALDYFHQGLVVASSGFEDSGLSSLPTVDQLNLNPLVLDLLNGKAQTLEATYRTNGNTEHLRSAKQVYLVASDFADKLQFNYKSEESKFRITRQVRDMYSSAVEVSYKLYEQNGDRSQLEEIFYFSERGKSRVLSELLQESNARSYSGIPDTLLQREQVLRSKITQLIIEIKQSNEASMQANTESLQDSLFQLNNRFRNYIKRLESEYPRYFDLKYMDQPVSLTALQRRLSEADETLIEYFDAGSSIYAIVVSPDHLDVVPLSKPDNFDEMVSAYLDRLRTGEKLDDYGFTIREALFSPIESLISTSNLVVVSEGLLSSLPFETLPRMLDESGAPVDYLLDRYSIRYAYSASLEQKIENQRNWGESGKSILAFAPAFAGKDVVTEFRTADTLKVSPLPISRYEVRQIAELFEESNGMFSWLRGDQANANLYVDNQATERRFKAESDSYRYLHIASHAFVDSKNPGQSGILFQPDKQGGGEDGVLYADEVYNMRLNAELVTLSACDTGRGTYIKGEGIIGLARPFFYAGARSLLVSLWPVSDRSTAEFMIGFYDRLLEGMTKTEALRQTKLEMQQSVNFSHPRYWSSFVLIGR